MARSMALLQRRTRRHVLLPGALEVGGKAEYLADREGPLGRHCSRQRRALCLHHNRLHDHAARRLLHALEPLRPRAHDDVGVCSLRGRLSEMLLYDNPPNGRPPR